MHIHEIGLLSGKQIAFHMHRSCATSTKQQQQQKEKIEKHCLYCKLYISWKRVSNASCNMHVHSERRRSPSWWDAPAAGSSLFEHRTHGAKSIEGTSNRRISSILCLLHCSRLTCNELVFCGTVLLTVTALVSHQRLLSSHRWPPSWLFSSSAFVSLESPACVLWHPCSASPFARTQSARRYCFSSSILFYC